MNVCIKFGCLFYELIAAPLNPLAAAAAMRGRYKREGGGGGV
jgi:hypothetical protein